MDMPSDTTSLRSRLSRLWRRAAASATTSSPTSSPHSSARTPRPTKAQDAPSRGAYQGDFTGTPELTYAPQPDGRDWQDIGSGAWNGRGRPSEVRVDRILRVDATAVRREGAVLDRERFDQVAAAVRAAR
jgi:hypothetical protein